MTESDARKIFLVRAVERIDPKGAILPLVVRNEAAKESGGSALLDGGSLEKGDGEGITKEEAAFLAGRSKLLAERLRIKNAVPKGVEGKVVPGWLGPILIIGVLLAGFFSANLGRDGAELNILALPILGILAWNLVVYVLALIGLISGASGRRAGVLTAMAGKLGRTAKGKLGAGKGGVLGREEEIELAAEWFEEKLPIHSSRFGMVLHLAAAALAVGGVGGLFYQGWSVEYVAVWESTLFKAESLAKFFGVLFAPASWVSGVEAPLGDLPEIQRGSGLDPTGGNALPWLQLYAVTMGIFVVVPRLIFAVIYRWHTARLCEDFPLSQAVRPYLTEVLRGLKGESLVAVVIPHAYSPGSKSRDSVRGMLHGLWGGGIFPDFQQTVDYGDEDEFLEKGGGLPNDPKYAVLLMNFSTTPEDEAQGFLAKGLREKLAAQSANGGEPGAGCSLLVLLDAAGFSERFHGLPEFGRRVEERKAAWERVIGRAGLGVATINLMGDKGAESGIGAGKVDEVGSQVWSPESGGGAADE